MAPYESTRIGGSSALESVTSLPSSGPETAFSSGRAYPAAARTRAPAACPRNSGGRMPAEPRPSSRSRSTFSGGRRRWCRFPIGTSLATGAHFRIAARCAVVVAAASVEARTGHRDLGIGGCTGTRWPRERIPRTAVRPATAKVLLGTTASPGPTCRRPRVSALHDTHQLGTTAPARGFRTCEGPLPMGGTANGPPCPTFLGGRTRHSLRKSAIAVFGGSESAERSPGAMELLIRWQPLVCGPLRRPRARPPQSGRLPVCMNPLAKNGPSVSCGRPDPLCWPSARDPERAFELLPVLG